LAPPLAVPSWGEHLRLGAGRQLLSLGSGGQARVFDLSPLADDNPGRLTPEQLRRLAEIQSIHTIHEGGDLVRLTTREWLERWRRMRDEVPGLMVWPEKE
jgi:hypothetical protein